MPRVSSKQRHLLQLKEKISELKLSYKQQKTLRSVAICSDESVASCDTLDILEDYIKYLEHEYDNISSRRYLLPRISYRKGFQDEVFSPHFNSNWLNENEFLEMYRMSRISFWYIHDLIKDHEIFQKRNKFGRSQSPVMQQLAVFLFYLGNSASGASNLQCRNMFGIGRGTSQVWRQRCVIAIGSLRSTYIKWPCISERRNIANRIYRKYRIPNCIAIADGTLFPLLNAPSTIDTPAYHGRKYLYSLSVMLINDDKKYIRYYLSGFPGSAHDQRIYANTDLNTEPETYFCDDQGKVNYYLIEDSAFSNTPTVVSAFKAYNCNALEKEKEDFNSVLGRLRVTSEHTIGILKGRFPFLKCIPMKLTKKRKSMKRILQIIDSCIILHNILLSNETENENQAWLDEEEEQSDIGEALGELDINNEIGEDESGDERRQMLFHFLKEYNAIIV